MLSRMSFVLLLVIALLILIAYFYYALIRAPRLQRPWSVVGSICLAAVIVASLAWFAIQRLATHPDQWRLFSALSASLWPWLLYLGVGTVVIAVINLIWSAGQAITGAKHLAPKKLIHTPRLRFVRVATVLAMVASIGVTAYGYNQAQHPQITETDITSTDLPAAFDGFRIALITDIHAGPGLGRDFVQGIVDQVNAAKPDLIVIDGDLSDGTPAQLGDDLMPLTTLDAPFGVLVTTGNHEFYDGAQPWIDWLNQHDLPVLDNEGTILIKGDSSIDILGINDRDGTPPHEADLQKAVDQLHSSFGMPVDGQGRFRILIAHEPLQVYDQNHLASTLGIDLMLSGHTHGGQLWPVQYLVKLGQPVVDGTNVLDGITVVTSRGAGAWGPPERVAAPPEIPIITLHCG